MKNLFTEHYIEVPDEKVDIVENLFDKVEELEEKLNSQIQENVKVKDELNDYRKNKILEEVCEDLADTQAEKMKSLVDGVTYEENADDFENKVKMMNVLDMRKTIDTYHKKKKCIEVLIKRKKRE